MTTWLSSLLAALASFLGIVQKQQELVNTPEMKKASSAGKDQERRSEIAHNVNARNTQAVQRDLAP